LAGERNPHLSVLPQELADKVQAMLDMLKGNQ
jgi:hypothetical protein